MSLESSPGNPGRPMPAGSAWRRWARASWWIALVIAGYQLFVPPIVGQADTGDMWRNMLAGGLDYAPGFDIATMRVVHAIEAFQIREPRFSKGDGGKWDDPAITSEILVIFLARAFHWVFGKTPALDIRYLGLAHLLLFMAGWRMCLEVGLRRLEPRAIGVASTLALLFFTDVGYVAYFNTAYGEAATLSFLSMVVGCALMAIDRGGFAWFSAFVIAALLFVVAKAQNSLALFPLGALVCVLARGGSRSRRTGVVAIGILAAGAAGVFQKGHMDAMRHADVYSAIFTGILPLADDPHAVMAEFGLDPRLEKYIGKTYWGSLDGPQGDPIFEADFADRTSFLPIVSYYARNPSRVLKICAKGAPDAFFLRMPYMGNFTPSSGMPPLSHSQAFSLWSSFKARVVPRQFATLLVVYGAAFALAGFAVVRGATLGGRLSAGLVLVIGSIGVLQYLTSILANGMEGLSRHLFLFNALTDLLLIVGVAAGLERWFRPGRTVPADSDDSKAVDPAG